jgi:hypothetical protein
MSARLKIAVLAASLIPGVVAGADSAAAQNDPVIVVPGRPGVPVMMNGVDVSGAVIEGETSLNRPDGAYPPTVIMRYWPPEHYRNPGPYFPATGHKPHYGRREVIPPADRQMPARAQRFYRDWSIESAPGPVSPTVPSDPAANGGAYGGAANGGALNGGAGFGAGQGLPSAAAQSPMVSPGRRGEEEREERRGERQERRGEEGKTRRGEERERAPLFHPGSPPSPVHHAPPPRRVHSGPPPRRVHRAPRPHTH